MWENLRHETRYFLMALKRAVLIRLTNAALVWWSRVERNTTRGQLAALQGDDRRHEDHFGGEAIHVKSVSP